LDLNSSVSNLVKLTTFKHEIIPGFEQTWIINGSYEPGKISGLNKPEIFPVLKHIRNKKFWFTLNWPFLGQEERDGEFG